MCSKKIETVTSLKHFSESCQNFMNHKSLSPRQLAEVPAVVWEPLRVDPLEGELGRDEGQPVADVALEPVARVWKNEIMHWKMNYELVHEQHDYPKKH